MLFKNVYNDKIKSIEYKISDITNLVTNTIPNANVNEVKGGIPSTTYGATPAALKANISEFTLKKIKLNNKIPNFSNSVKKTYYDTKISKIENKIAI